MDAQRPAHHLRRLPQRQHPAHRGHRPGARHTGGQRQLSEIGEQVSEAETVRLHRARGEGRQRLGERL